MGARFASAFPSVTLPGTTASTNGGPGAGEVVVSWAKVHERRGRVHLYEYLAAPGGPVIENGLSFSVIRCDHSSLYTPTSLCIGLLLTLQSWHVHTVYGRRDVQQARAAQVSLLRRSYRESFSPIGGRRGLTQEALLEWTGSVDSDYAERYSHATVSRWESGGTRPTLQRRSSRSWRRSASQDGPSICKRSVSMKVPPFYSSNPDDRDVYHKCSS